MQHGEGDALGHEQYFETKKVEIEWLLSELVNELIVEEADNPLQWLLGRLQKIVDDQQSVSAPAARLQKGATTVKVKRSKTQHEWTIGSWVGSLDLSAPVEAALLDLPSLKQDGLSAFKCLQSGSFTEDMLKGGLEKAHLDGLATEVWAATLNLKEQAEATGAALNDRFASQADYELAFGSLPDFFDGLEAKIGPADPKVSLLPPGLRMNAMKQCPAVRRRWKNA